MTGAFATPVAVLAACQSLPLLCSLPLLIIASVDVGVVVLSPYAAVWVLGPARPAVASTSHQFTASACEACQRVFFSARSSRHSQYIFLSVCVSVCVCRAYACVILFSCCCCSCCLVVVLFFFSIIFIISSSCPHLLCRRHIVFIAALLRSLSLSPSFVVPSWPPPRRLWYNLLSIYLFVLFGTRVPRRTHSAQCISRAVQCNARFATLDVAVAVAVAAKKQKSSLSRCSPVPTLSQHRQRGSSTAAAANCLAHSPWCTRRTYCWPLWRYWRRCSSGRVAPTSTGSGAASSSCSRRTYWATWRRCSSWRSRSPCSCAASTSTIASATSPWWASICSTSRPCSSATCSWRALCWWRTLSASPIGLPSAMWGTTRWDPSISSLPASPSGGRYAHASRPSSRAPRSSKCSRSWRRWVPPHPQSPQNNSLLRTLCNKIACGISMRWCCSSSRELLFADLFCHSNHWQWDSIYIKCITYPTLSYDHFLVRKCIRWCHRLKMRQSIGGESIGHSTQTLSTHLRVVWILNEYLR